MRTFRRETALYLLALFLALAVRLIGLDRPPLNDLEAKWALQALGVAQGIHPALGSQPAYVVLTSILFFAYGGATNFLARLIPALMGSALALMPRLFRERLKPRPALILGFFLALEPGLVALSRQAGSSILAVTFLLFAWGMWDRRHASWVGVFGGLALLSGAALWLGLLTFGLAWAISQAWGRGALMPSADRRATRERREWLNALWFGLATIVFGGSLLFLAPSGLSAWLSGVPEYLAGWAHPSGPSTSLMLFSLVAYQPLGLILALVASVRGWLQGSWRVRQLSLWILVGLLLVLFHPARQIGDLAWMLIPLWALAALELARSLNVRREERREILGVVVLTFLLLVFIWLDFLGLIQVPLPSDQATLRLWLIFGSSFLLVMSLLLVAVGWSQRVARYGAIWGLVAALGIYSFSALMSAAELRDLPDGVELWRPGASLPESGLLLATVNDMSDWSKKDVHAQPITIVGIDSPALAWLFHERTVSIQSTLDPSAEPPMVITVDQENPRLDAAYRGQSFVWRRTPLWSESSLSDWLHWLPFHQISQESERVILWVRSDLFLDSNTPRP
jgi:hypothetical protein